MCSDPDLIHRIVSDCKLENPDLCISVKIRILDSLEDTIKLAKAIESAGKSLCGRVVIDCFIHCITSVSFSYHSLINY